MKTQEFNKKLLHTAYDIFQLFKVKMFAKILVWIVMTVLLTLAVIFATPCGMLNAHVHALCSIDLQCALQRG